MTILSKSHTRFPYIRHMELRTSDLQPSRHRLYCEPSGPSRKFILIVTKVVRNRSSSRIDPYDRDIGGMYVFPVLLRES